MKEKRNSYIFIIIISIIISIPLFSSRYDIYIDDGIQHICRIMGTYQSIMEGQKLPVIMSNFCNSFGYSWNLFYSPITAYIPLLFHFITSSFVLDIKLFMLFVTILTGISMHECIYTITKNKWMSLLGSIIYILAPYRLTDMYIRMALAEFTSFIFIPMVFQGLYIMFHEENNSSKKSVLILTLGAVGLVLTHLIIAMYTAIFAFIYLLCNIKKINNKYIIKKLMVSLIFIIFITSFFIFPLIEQKSNTNFEVFKPGRMERTDVLVYYKLDFLDFIYTDAGNMVFEIGIITIIGLLLTICTYKKIDKEYKTFYIFSLIMGLISLFMTLNVFPFEKLPPILKMIQFSFRMLEFSNFFFAIVVSINFILSIKDFEKKDIIVLTSIIIMLLIPMLIRNVRYADEVIDEKKLWPAISVTEKTGRVHAGCASFEYLPCKAFENLDYIKTRSNKAIIIDKNCKILNEYKSGANMSFDVLKAEKGTKIELPFIFYLGYQVKININGEEEILKINESNNGFIEIELTESVNNGKIEVSYVGTNIMKLGICVSILSFTIMILYCYIYRRIEC